MDMQRFNDFKRKTFPLFARNCITGTLHLRKNLSYVVTKEVEGYVSNDLALFITKYEFNNYQEGNQCLDSYILKQEIGG